MIFWSLDSKAVRFLNGRHSLTFDHIKMEDTNHTIVHFEQCSRTHLLLCINYGPEGLALN